MRLFTICLLSLLILSCALQDMDSIDFHDRQRDGWSWIIYKKNDIIVNTFEKKEDSSDRRYCNIFELKSCMFFDPDGTSYIEISLSDHDYDKMITHFKRHIDLIEDGKYFSHSKYIDTCEIDFNCENKHVYIYHE